MFFYDIIHTLGSSLRSIFVPYFGYMIPHIINILKKAPNSPSEALLHSKILKSLTLCFMNDTSGFVTPDLFEKLLQPLVDLLDQVDDEVEIDEVSENEDETSAMKYLSRMKVYFLPCVVQLAVNLNNEALWKPLNYQLLLKTRSEKAIVRYAALSTVSGLYNNLGEQFLPLLPESMQYISELLEDEDPRVEKLTSQLVKNLERLLGDGETLRELLK